MIVCAQNSYPATTLIQCARVTARDISLAATCACFSGLLRRGLSQVCNPGMKGMCVMADKKAPMYRVYSVIARAKQDDFWLNVGSAFPHEDGKGFNVLLQALPIGNDGSAKLVIREYVPKEGEKPDGDTPKKA